MKHFLYRSIESAVTIIVTCMILLPGCSKSNESDQSEGSDLEQVLATVGEPTAFDLELDRFKSAGGALDGAELRSRVGIDQAAKVHRTIFEPINALTPADVEILRDTEDMKAMSALLEFFPETLATLHQATSLAPCNWEINYEDSFAVLWPSFKFARNAARLLRAEAYVRAADGDFEGAADSIESGLRLARQTSESPSLSGMLVDSAIEALMLSTMEEIFRDHPLPVDSGIRATIEHRNRLDDFRMSILAEGTMMLELAWFGPDEWTRNEEAAPMLRRHYPLARQMTEDVARPQRGEPLPVDLERDLVFLLEMVRWDAESLERPTLSARGDERNHVPPGKAPISGYYNDRVTRIHALAARHELLARIALYAMDLRAFHRDHGRVPRRDELEPPTNPWDGYPITYSEQPATGAFVIEAQTRGANSTLKWTWRWAPSGG